jgi:hypothetical protein
MGNVQLTPDLSPETRLLPIAGSTPDKNTLQFAIGGNKEHLLTTAHSHPPHTTRRLIALRVQNPNCALPGCKITLGLVLVRWVSLSFTTAFVS